MNTLVEKIIDNGDGTYSKNSGSAGAMEPQARSVTIINTLSVAGDKLVLPADTRRTGLTIRNDSAAAMYFNVGNVAGDGIGYPMDPRRGYSFESFGLIPSDAIHVWCGEANNRIAVMYSTEVENA